MNKFNKIEIFQSKQNISQIFLCYNISQKWEEVIIIELDGNTVERALFGDIDDRFRMSEILNNVSDPCNYVHVDDIDVIKKIGGVICKAFAENENNVLLNSLLKELNQF